MPTKRTPLSDETISQLATLTANGRLTRQKAIELGVPSCRYPAIKQAADEEVAKYKAKTGVELRKAVGKLSRRLARDAGAIPINSAAITLGILVEKEQLLREQAGAPQSLHLHLKGDVGSTLAAILGPQAAILLTPPAKKEIDVTLSGATIRGTPDATSAYPAREGAA